MSTDIALTAEDAEIVRTSDEWAGIIRADLTSAVEGIVAAGRHLIAAKADVKHGEWLPLLKTIGISQQWASQLMTIAKNPAITNNRNYGDLPNTITALFELSRLEPERVEEKIASGDINPEMTIKDAKKLHEPESKPITDPIPESAPAPLMVIEPHSEDKYAGIVEVSCNHCGEFFPPEQTYEAQGGGFECDGCVEQYGYGEEYSGPGPALETAAGERKSPRKPLPDAFAKRAGELLRAAESLEKLCGDDRFAGNADRISDRDYPTVVRAKRALDSVHNALSDYWKDSVL